MYARLIGRLLRNERWATALMVASVATGTVVTTSFMAIALDIEGRVAEELRSFGANIVIEPRVEGLADLAEQQRFLNEADLPKARTIFWRYNIVGLAPFLDASLELSSNGRVRRVAAVGLWMWHELPQPGEEGTFEAGVKTVAPWWEVTGTSPGDDSVLLGTRLAADLDLVIGDHLTLGGRDFEVSGVVRAGAEEDEQVFFDLATLQVMLGLQGKLSRVWVSALTTPMDDFAYKDPDAMAPAEYEKWYCTGYVTSIALQLQEVFEGASAKPVWKIAQAEGQVLERLSLFIHLLAAVAFLASALGMSTTMSATFLRRRQEIALMKAMGAGRAQVLVIVLLEAGFVGLLGGFVGYGLSVVTADWIGSTVFGTALARRSLLGALALSSALCIACLSSLAPIRSVLTIKPTAFLKEVV